MENFVELRERCQEKVKESETLYMAFASQILKRDIDRLAQNMSGRLVRVNDEKYILDEKITLYLRDDGCVWIVDDRGSAFSWLFEVKVECTELIYGDIFSHNGELYKVEFLSDRTFEGAHQEVENFMKCAEKSIEVLKATNNLDTWNYHYEHENKRYDTLYACIQRVLKRKPENR